jgi:hypothetical protein
MSWLVTSQQKVPVDPLFNNVSLLLHGDGTNGSTSIIDSSPSPKTLTAFGNAQISTAIADPFGNATGVIAFDGSSDYLSISSDTDLALGATWTVEFFVYLNALGGGDNRNVFVSTGTPNTNGHLNIYTEYTQQGPYLVIRCGGSGGNDAISGNNPFGVTTWTHLAFVSDNLAATIYVNGTANGTGTLASASTEPISNIGTIVFSAYDLDGYIAEFRITKGIARYNSNFTPPTAPFPDI